MIQYVNADISNDGLIRVRVKDTKHFVLTLWERDSDDLWCICDCKDINTVEHPLTEHDIDHYSVVCASIVIAMTTETP